MSGDMVRQSKAVVINETITTETEASKRKRPVSTKEVEIKFYDGKSS